MGRRAVGARLSVLTRIQRVKHVFVRDDFGAKTRKMNVLQVMWEGPVLQVRKLVGQTHGSGKVLAVAGDSWRRCRRQLEEMRAGRLLSTVLLLTH